MEFTRRYRWNDFRASVIAIGRRAWTMRFKTRFAYVRFARMKQTSLRSRVARGVFAGDVIVMHQVDEPNVLETLLHPEQQILITFLFLNK